MTVDEALQRVARIAIRLDAGESIRIEPDTVDHQAASLVCEAAVGGEIPINIRAVDDRAAACATIAHRQAEQLGADQRRRWELVIDDITTALHTAFDAGAYWQATRGDPER